MFNPALSYFYRSGRLTNNCSFLLVKQCMLNNSCLLSGSQTLERRKKNDNLAYTTTVILQDGLNVRELPAVVKKVSGGYVTCRDFNSDNDLEKKPANASSNNSISKLGDDVETKEIIEGLKRCFTPKGVFVLLETIPENEVTPEVALEALTKIIDLENSQYYRNLLTQTTEEKPENFARTAIFNQLVNIIVSSGSTNIVLECLRILSREYNLSSVLPYKDKVTEEVLLRASDGEINILQLCEIVKIISSLNVNNATDIIDRLWITLSEKRHEIDETNITKVFHILPFLKQSQKMLLNILEKKLIDIWWKVPSKVIVEALSVISAMKLSSVSVLQVASRWTNTNIHAVSEDDLFSIVSSFISLNYTDSGIEKALERYIKAKGLKVKNTALIAIVLDYCYTFRYRSHHILNCCGEYLIRHGKELSPLIIKSMFVPLGYLDYHPSNGLEFWKALEDVLEEKFALFRPEDIIDVMLACLYLEKYPINFVKKIFSPYFMDRVHSQEDTDVLMYTRMKLKLFDTAMSLDCPQYGSRMLPKDYTAKSAWLDGRVRRAAGFIEDCLRTTLGRREISVNVALPHLPLTDLYIVDIVVHPPNLGPFVSWNLSRDRNLYLAVLIHLPEHYCLHSQKLIGPQIMRKRHYRKLGFKVVTMDFTTLSKLRVYPKELNDYVAERLKMAEDAFPSGLK